MSEKKYYLVEIDSRSVVMTIDVEDYLEGCDFDLVAISKAKWSFCIDSIHDLTINVKQLNRSEYESEVPRADIAELSIKAE